MVGVGYVAYGSSCTIGDVICDDGGWTTLVVRAFLIEESFLRLIFSILMIFSEKWECSRLYIKIKRSWDNIKAV